MAYNDPIGKANNGKPRPRRLAFLLSLFFSLLSLISPVNAQSDVSLTELPQNFADALGISLFGGQIILSGIFMLMFILPVVLLTRRGRSSMIPELAITLVVMGGCIAIGWLPYWFLVIIVMIIAFMMSSSMRKLITGK